MNKEKIKGYQNYILYEPITFMNIIFMLLIVTALVGVFSVVYIPLVSPLISLLGVLAFILLILLILKLIDHTYMYPNHVFVLSNYYKYVKHSGDYSSKDVKSASEESYYTVTDYVREMYKTGHPLYKNKYVLVSNPELQKVEKRTINSIRKLMLRDVSYNTAYTKNLVQSYADMYKEVDIYLDWLLQVDYDDKESIYEKYPSVAEYFKLGVKLHSKEESEYYEDYPKHVDELLEGIKAYYKEVQEIDTLIISYEDKIKRDMDISMEPIPENNYASNNEYYKLKLQELRNKWESKRADVS